MKFNWNEPVYLGEQDFRIIGRTLSNGCRRVLRKPIPEPQYKPVYVTWKHIAMRLAIPIAVVFGGGTVLDALQRDPSPVTSQNSLARDNWVKACREAHAGMMSPAGLGLFVGAVPMRTSNLNCDPPKDLAP